MLYTTFTRKAKVSSYKQSHESSQPSFQGLSSNRLLRRVRRDPGLEGGVLCNQAVCCVELCRLVADINRDV